MIDYVEAQGFKCFLRSRLELRKLSLLAGMNGSGKSSAIQPVLLVAQGLRHAVNAKVFPLNGALVQLGSAGDVLSTDAESNEIRIEVGLIGGRSISWSLTVVAGDRMLYRRNITGDPNIRDSFESPIVDDSGLRDLVFLGATRPGAVSGYQYPDNSPVRGDVGCDGRFAAFWYSTLSDDEIPTGRRSAQESAASFRKQLDAWMSFLFGSAQANVQHHAAPSIFSLQFRMSETGDWKQPANTGYGLSYAFPIVTSLLAAKEGQVMVIDSPEAHLHPYAQSQMGRMLAQFAAAGVQIIVETHSDHLLNGARVAIRDGLIDPADVSLSFFRRDEARSSIERIEVDGRGRLAHWPEGFFDQIEIDLARL